MNYNEKLQLEQALMNSILRNEDEYLHQQGLTKSIVFMLPSPQTSGTETQKQTYARLKAKELIDNTKL